MSKLRAIWHLIFAEHWYVCISTEKPQRTTVKGLEGKVVVTNGLTICSGYEEVVPK